MLSIRKVMPDNFSVMTDHGTYSMSTVRQLVNHIEKELDITIYDRTLTDAIAILEDQIDQAEDGIAELNKQFKELKEKVKERDKS